MMVLLAPAWRLVSWAFARSKLGARFASSRKLDQAASAEEMSPDLLFGCLLSANFAVLMNDNFNQLASALPEERVKKLLAEQWGIGTRADCIRAIEKGMPRLGEISTLEMEAVDAWLREQRSRDDIANFSRLRIERLASTDRLGQGHLSVLAWDIQQFAYLIRLALATGHVSRSQAEAVLGRLTVRARGHYGSWAVYSMAAVAGLGMRSAMEVFETSAWDRYLRTHAAFLDGRQAPTRFEPWSEANTAPLGSPRGLPRPAAVTTV